ncbi:MAG: ParB family transcriptional regulator, chromosome partitioning protein [Acidimicrobiaceae bacterium]|nr:ParB family transcriptional regulator, chromosome partitioning protein [Acidimicrobiaceae bacterium]
MRRAGLGKGLGALIPSEGMRDEESSLQDIPLNLIEPNPNQPRIHFDEEALSELAASIRELGVLQPILVRNVDGDRYQIVAGERRWRAARRAGLATVPAMVRDVDEATSVEQALVENLQREDLNPLEEAAAYQQLIEDFQLTHDDVAKRVGRSRAAVTNTLRLLQLPAAVQHLVSENRLSPGHARALLGTPDRSLQEALARRALEESWTVRALEDAIREVVATAPATDEPLRARRPSLRPPGLLELEELLSDHLDTRVRVTMAAKRGKVIIEFATLEDLERIYRVISEPAAPA